MEVIVGTYNQVIFSFSFAKDTGNEEKWLFEPKFTDQGHAGCIKSVATGAKYLASGSTDETIRLFDLKKHVELGTLMHQNGTITCLAFVEATHMLSGSEDGTICIWDCKSWEIEKTLKGHRGAINSISVHPSGRVALSISKDKTVRTWNLLTGRAAYVTSLKAVGELVRWCPSGNSYAISFGRKVDIHKLGTATDPVSFECEKPVLAMEFVSDSVILIAGESDDVIVFNVDKECVLQRFQAHSIRTKAISVVEDPDDPSALIMFSVASDGNLKACRLNKENFEEAPLVLAEIEIPGRPTCMNVKSPYKDVKISKKKVQSKKGETLKHNANSEGPEESITETKTAEESDNVSEPALKKTKKKKTKNSSNEK